MSMVTYPLNNIEYTAEDAELFHLTRTSGVYATNAFNYSATGADNTIVIETGIAWIKNSEFSGKVVAQKAPISLDMGLPDSVYPRIDAVVIQFDANKNGTEVVVKHGIPASAPVAPEVAKTEALYELHLYHVRREPGAAAVSVSNITDLRLDPNCCGLMADSVTQIDTAAISAQVNALIESLRQEIQSVKDGSAYLMRSGGDMTGPINMNGQAIKGLTEPTADDEAVNWGVAKKAIHKNLLDNSDFRNPVNQRGQTSYTGARYTVDRWQQNGGNVITVGDKGLDFVVNTPGNSAAFYQKIENVDKFLGKKLTFVVYTDRGNILSVAENPGIYPANSSYYGTVQTEYGYIQLMLTATPKQLYAIFSPKVNCTIYQAALYEGEYTAETLPEYHPKGFGAELVECSRYFKKSSKVYRSATSSDVAPGVNFEISMRIVPTVKIFDCDMNEGYVSVWTDDGISKVAVNSAPAFADGIFYIDAPVPAGCMVGYSYEASADL